MYYSYLIILLLALYLFHERLSTKLIKLFKLFINIYFCVYKAHLSIKSMNLKKQQILSESILF